MFLPVHAPTCYPWSQGTPLKATSIGSRCSRGSCMAVLGVQSYVDGYRLSSLVHRDPQQLPSSTGEDEPRTVTRHYRTLAGDLTPHLTPTHMKTGKQRWTKAPDDHRASARFS
jgi:hypothetical protein